MMKAKLSEVLDNKDEDLVIQFSFRYESLIECSAFEFKLIRDDPTENNDEDLYDTSNYLLRFGVDLCGSIQRVSLGFN